MTPNGPPQSPLFRNNEQEQAPEKLEQLFGHCFEISRIDDGDIIPVGGENIFSTEMDIKMKADLEGLDTLFSNAHNAWTSYKLPKLREWLDLQGVDIGETLFAKLFAFTKALEEIHKEDPERSKRRSDLYAKRDKEELKLSDFLEANSMECAEVAVLAQVYLQREKIPSTYFNGDVLWNREWETSEEHAFIVIRLDGKLYVYDPTIPFDTNQGKYPSIYTTETNFDEEMRQGKKCFVSVRNIFTQKEAFFGVNDGTVIKPERDIL